MKRLLFLMLTLVAFVACESEYDKMSEYEKAIYDVGTNSKMSLVDVLKNTQFWVESKVISSSLPEGKGEVSVADYNGSLVPDGGIRYAFIFNDRFRYYTSSLTGLEYLGFYADYKYTISEGNVICLEGGPNLNDYKVFGMAFDKIKVIAYNESSLVIEICDSKDKHYPYKTFVLKAGTQSKKDKLENHCTDVETFEGILADNN